MQRALVFGAALAALSFPAISLAAAPTATLNIEVGSPTGDPAVRVFACFTEIVTGFEAADVQITNGSIGAFTATSSSEISCTDLYTFVVTASGDPVTVTVDLPPNTVENSGDFNSATSTVSWDYDSSLAFATELSGRTWYDANQDGVRTVGADSCTSTGGGDACVAGVEANVSGITVSATPVLNAAGTTDASRSSMSTTTNSEGGYFFYFDSSAQVGKWRISQTLPSGWTQTLPTTTDAFYDVNVEDTFGTITRNNYATALNYDFGSYDPSLVADVTPLAAPTTTPDAGTFASVQTVTLGTASSSATTTSIRYTLGGATPSCPATGELYAGAFSVASSSTLRAIACSDASTSTVASFDFVINLPPESPTSSPAAGSFSALQNVTLSSASTTASIYYTTDGSEPVCGVSSLFSSAIPLNASVALRAVACGGGATSTSAEFSFSISIPASSSGSSGGGGGGNGPPSDNVPVNAAPPSQGGGGVPAGNAVIPTPPPEQGEVLGVETSPSAEIHAPPQLSTPETSAPAEAIAEELPAPASPESQAAAAGLAQGGFPAWLAALILLVLLLLWALWAWMTTQSSH